ncbi:MAG: VOC family protein [Bacteroidetes bacterium]|nr:VOC family protein [Bacteroidota bacterium]
MSNTNSIMRIQHLKLYSGNLDDQRTFYTEVLGLDLIQEDNYSFSVQVGETTLTFEETQFKPCYHFAINIPNNQLEHAADWLRSKVNLLPFEGKEVIDFPNWNAQAVYFYDADHNIVECIARRDLPNQSDDLFDSSSFLEISEVGLPTSDVLSIAGQLEAEAGLGIYSGDRSRFCAIGDPQGLFIVVDYHQKDWIPNMDPAIPFPFTVTCEVDGAVVLMDYRDEQLVISG